MFIGLVFLAFFLFTGLGLLQFFGISLAGGGPGRHITGHPAAVELLRASLQLTSSLQVPRALRALVESSCSLTGALAPR